MNQNVIGYNFQFLRYLLVKYYLGQYRQIIVSFHVKDCSVSQSSIIIFFPLPSLSTDHPFFTLYKTKGTMVSHKIIIQPLFFFFFSSVASFHFLLFCVSMLINSQIWVHGQNRCSKANFMEIYYSQQAYQCSDPTV